MSSSFQVLYTISSKKDGLIQAVGEREERWFTYSPRNYALFCPLCGRLWAKQRIEPPLGEEEIRWVVDTSPCPDCGLGSPLSYIDLAHIEAVPREILEFTVKRYLSFTEYSWEFPQL